MSPRDSPAGLFRGGVGIFDGDRNANRERAAGPDGIVAALNLPAMRAHKSVADAQTETGALAGLLGGEERIKNTLHVRDSGTVVADGDLNPLAGMRGAQENPPAATGFLDGVVGIVQQVQKYLLQLLRIPKNRRKLLVILLADFHTMARKVVSAQFGGLAKNRTHIHQFALDRALPRKAQQILHDVFGALGFLRIICKSSRAFVGT